MADVDGSNMELLLKGRNLGSPIFSPNMQWILFEGGAQIYKVPFEGDSIDVSKVVKLSPEGRFFYPDWSSDGKRVVYSNTIGDTVGIWISPTGDSLKKRYFSHGGDPDWLLNGEEILYGATGLWIERVDHTSKIQIFSEHEKVIRDINGFQKNKRIAFSSELNKKKERTGFQVFIISFKGRDLKQLTTRGGIEPAWTPGG